MPFLRNLDGLEGRMSARWAKRIFGVGCVFCVVMFVGLRLNDSAKVRQTFLRQSLNACLNSRLSFPPLGPTCQFSSNDCEAVFTLVQNCDVNVKIFPDAKLVGVSKWFTRPFFDVIKKSCHQRQKNLMPVINMKTPQSIFHIGDTWLFFF